jgi:hypothetical protein
MPAAAEAARLFCGRGTSGGRNVDIFVDISWTRGPDEVSGIAGRFRQKVVLR